MTVIRRSGPVSHKRADLAYEHIKRRLITGELAAGARVDLNVLVNELATSRQPVQAAINRLAGEGFFRVVPQVGCWVASVDEREVADFFRLFALTEGVACELAAERRTAAGVVALRANLQETLRLLAEPQDPAALAVAFFRLNREFHGRIHEMATSRFVGDMAGGMWDRCDFYLASADPGIQSERVMDSEREHERIVDALAAGDGSEARRLMVAHIESFGSAAVARLHATVTA